MKKENRSDAKAVTKYADAILNNMRTQSRFAEAYRTLRTNIHFSVTDRKIRSILITSAGQSEGKTVTAYNLAYTVAQASKSVLIIDADLRKPMLSKLFNLEKTPVGLTGLLADISGTEIGVGTLDEFSVNDLFWFITLQKRSGFLELSNAQDTVEMFFLEGKLTDVVWTSRPEDKKLVNMLIADGIIPVDAAEAALARQKDTGQKFETVLIQSGIVSESQLTGHLNMHLMETFQVISRMTDGVFRFRQMAEGEMPPQMTGMLNPHEIYEQKIGKSGAFIYLENRIDTAIITTRTPGLFVLPCGRIPANPSELLGTDRMAFLISHLKKRFDFLVVDTPPILPASDALMLAPQLDGVALVVRSGLLKRIMVTKAVEQLQRSHANILGIILNRVDSKQESYYKYYHKYYAEYNAENV